MMGGSPSDIPFYLQKLLLHDKEVRRYYWDCLEGTLIFSELGHLPEPALQFTLPLLFELLESDVFQENAWILFFLFMVLMDSKSSDHEMVKQFQEYIKSRITLIYQYTTDSNLATRFSALDVLQAFLDDSDQFTDYTLALIEAETNIVFQVYTTAYLAMYLYRNKLVYSSQGLQTRNLLLQMLDKVKSKPQKGVLIYSVVQLLNMRVSQSLVDIIRDWQQNPKEYEIESDISWHEDYEDLIFTPNFSL